MFRAKQLVILLVGSMIIGIVGSVERAAAQEVPESVRQELQEQGMTVEEARRQAEELGIDLSNPQQAARRARELGIPEARIQALLQAYEQSTQRDRQTGAMDAQTRLRPTLSGNAVVSPDTVLVDDLPTTVSVRVRLRNETVITEVRPFFISAMSRTGGGDAQQSFGDQSFGDQFQDQSSQQQELSGRQLYTPEQQRRLDAWMEQERLRQQDASRQPAGRRTARGQSPFDRSRRLGVDTLRVENVRRVSGTTSDGVWEGRITLPIDLEPGIFALRVRITDRDEVSTVLSTNRFLVVQSDRADLAERDTVEAPRDTLRYFGYDIFRSVPDAFEPSAMGPVDDGYLVGPNDELRLTAWGATQFQYDLPVDSEGRIFIPNVGQYTVAGKRLDDLRGELRDWLSQRYAGLTSDPPTISMDLTVTRVRPVQVYVLGEVRYPGGYTVGSGSTVFNVLYSMGGPLRRGSLRNIQVIRDGEVVEQVDLYDYLMRGYNPNPVRLQNNDFIYIPPRGKTVAITGQVRRPAYFEMQPDETLDDVLTYAGGLKPEAYAGRAHIERIVPFTERTDPSVAREALDVRLQDVMSGEETVPLADADFITVPSILELDSRSVAARVNAVNITGAVFQPGQYELDEQVRTVRDLIEAADGLRGDAHKPQAELIRLQDDLDEESRTLNLNRVMEDDPRANVVLQPGDSLHVASVQDLKIERTVRISGQVLNPGTYTHRDSMTVSDLLFKGGGLTDDEYLKDVFLDRADLYREASDGRSERVIPFHLGDALNGDGLANEVLRPGDEIRVYPVDVEVLRDRFVEISGAVKNPDRYEFRENMTLKDIILQAEGFQEGAFLEAVEVTRRPADGNGQERARTLQVGLAPGGAMEQISFAVDDTVRALEAADRFQLQHRDRVYVRTDPNFQEQETIAVRGEVRFPGEYTLLRENETLASLINRAGGVRATGYPKGGRLFRDTSQVIVEMDRAIEGEPGSDVILQPGDEVVIPPQPNTVAVRGNVANEGLLKFRPGERVAYYLERAGGTLDDTERIFLTQASGATFEVDRGWFRRTPQVDDGATIRVTRKPPESEREGIDVGEIVTDTVSILSSALTIIVLSRRAFD